MLVSQSPTSKPGPSVQDMSMMKTAAGSTPKTPETAETGKNSQIETNNSKVFGIYRRREISSIAFIFVIDLTSLSHLILIGRKLAQSNHPWDLLYYKLAFIFPRFMDSWALSSYSAVYILCPVQHDIRAFDTSCCMYIPL